MMAGRADESVMVWTPDVLVLMAKVMVSSPALALALEMAARSVPSPESKLLVTVKLAAVAVTTDKPRHSNI